MSNLFKFIFSKVFVINLIIAIVLIGVGFHFLGNYLGAYTLHGESITVPNFNGILVDELDDFIADKELKYEIIDSIYSLNQPKGAVVDQNPIADFQVKRGRLIYLTINARATEKTKLPALADMTLKQATAVLETHGLKVGIKEYKPDECFNCVLEIKLNDEVIESGISIEKGTSVDLVLGQGTSSELTAVPQLLGLSKPQVKDLLANSAINSLFVRFDGCPTQLDSNMARVYKQDPISGDNSFINLGSSIKLWFTCDSNLTPIVLAPDSIIATPEDSTNAE